MVDRFLEHGRVFTFLNAGRAEVYLASADWMPRNFHRRVEVMVPIEDAAIRSRLLEILELQLQDNVKSWRLTSAGHYERVGAKGAALMRVQVRFVEMTRDKVKTSEVIKPSSRFVLPRPEPIRSAPRRRDPTAKK